MKPQPETTSMMEKGVTRSHVFPFWCDLKPAYVSRLLSCCRSMTLLLRPVSMLLE
jgi:hypothetical protein